MATPSRTDTLLRAGLDILGASSGIGALLARGLGGRGPSSVGADGSPAEDYPNPLHTVEVGYRPGHGPNLNAELQRTVADHAAEMQSLKQHNDTLLKYLRALPPTASERERHLALMKGVEEEQALDEYWDDKSPRKNFTPSSSAVKAVRITPDNRVEVMWGSTPGKWYSYKQHENPRAASIAAKRLLTSGSIGRALLRNSQKYGSWGRREYDAAMA